VHLRYTPYFQLNTELIPQQLELTLVTHLNKETIPGAYSLKKFTRRLLPNDYMVPSDVVLYLKNLTDRDINIEFYSIHVEQKHLPFSSRKLKIPAKGYYSVRLGQVNVDLRLTSLYTGIEYNAENHKEDFFDMRRISKQEEATHENDKVNTEVNTEVNDEAKVSNRSDNQYTHTHTNDHTHIGDAANASHIKHQTLTDKNEAHTHDQYEYSIIEFKENNPIERYFRRTITK
jgi:hypothetical protein